MDRGARRELAALLGSLFNQRQLVRFVDEEVEGGGAVLDEVDDGRSFADLRHGLVDQLDRAGRIDASFWAALLRKVPGRSADIQAVQALATVPALLTAAQRAQVQQGFADGGLLDDAALDALDAVLDRELVRLLPPTTSAQQRFQATLALLDGVPGWSQGSIPLAAWLRRAVDLADDPAAAGQLAQVLATLDGGAAPPADLAPTSQQTLEGLTLEKQLGSADQTLSVAFLLHGAQAAASVCRLMVPRVFDGVVEASEGDPSGWSSGTGWLIGPGLVATNHHVVEARMRREGPASAADMQQQAQGTRVLFRLFAEEADAVAVPVTELLAHDRDLDVAILRVGASPATTTPLRLRPDPVMKAAASALSARVNVLQHPDGRPMRVGFRSNFIVSGDGSWLSYLTDTSGGSSGSPVCDEDWRVVALHRGWRPLQGPGITLDGRAIHAENYGVPVSRILAWLQAAAPAVHAEVLAGQAALG